MYGIFHLNGIIKPRWGAWLGKNMINSWHPTRGNLFQNVCRALHTWDIEGRLTSSIAEGISHSHPWLMYIMYCVLALHIPKKAMCEWNFFDFFVCVWVTKTPPHHFSFQRFKSHNHLSSVLVDGPDPASGPCPDFGTDLFTTGRFGGWWP